MTAAICPLLRTVSSGNRIQSSTAAEVKVKNEYAVGVRRGSTPRRERRMRGVDVVRRLGSVELRKVMGRSDGGQKRDGSERREVRRARGG